MPKRPPTGGVRLQEVSVSGGSTVLSFWNKQVIKSSLRGLE